MIFLEDRKLTESNPEVGALYYAEMQREARPEAALAAGRYIFRLTSHIKRD